MLIRINEFTYVEGSGISSVQLVVLATANEGNVVEIRHAGVTDGVMIDDMTLADVLGILNDASVTSPIMIFSRIRPTSNPIVGYAAQPPTHGFGASK